MTTEEIKKIIQGSDKIVLIDVYGMSCAPCIHLDKALTELKNTGKYANNLVIEKINGNEEVDFAAEHRISGVPTLLFFKEGKIIQRKTGWKNMQDLIETIEEVLKK